MWAQIHAGSVVPFAGADHVQTAAAITRTPDGEPILRSVWTSSSLSRPERFPEFSSLVLSEAGAKGW